MYNNRLIKTYFIHYDESNNRENHIKKHDITNNAQNKTKIIYKILIINYTGFELFLLCEDGLELEGV